MGAGRLADHGRNVQAGNRRDSRGDQTHRQQDDRKQRTRRPAPRPASPTAQLIELTAKARRPRAQSSKHSSNATRTFSRRSAITEPHNSPASAHCGFFERGPRRGAKGGVPAQDEDQVHWADRNGRSQSCAEASVAGVLPYRAARNHASPALSQHVVATLGIRLMNAA